MMAAAWLTGILAATADPSASDLALREQSRRNAAVEEAGILLTKGDEAYQAGRYAQAVEAYSGAREMIPDAPVSAELRRAATERFSQASVERAKELSRKGDVAGAKAVMDKVLAESVAPNDPAALALRARLDDPIRTNPALTAEHAKDVDQVRRLLYTAEGAYDLGKFDEATKQYEDVLRIDPTNIAARRGMEKLAGARSEYGKSAFDHTRAELLSQVDASWELQVPAPELGVGLADPGAPVGVLDKVTVSTKLKRIIIPKIALDQSSLDEAVEFIRVKAAENDITELDPSRKGLNITVNLGPPDSETAMRIRDMRFDLRLSNVPLATVLKYITEITKTSYTTDDFAVVIRPHGSASDELLARSFSVPPDFLTNLSANTGAEKPVDDPFATDAPAGGGLLTTRMSAQDAFAKQGISFPAGASAIYNASTNTLRVVNTATNLDLISQFVDTLNQTEPVLVSVKVTMIRTQRTNLKELGFDWLLNPMSLNSEGSVFGSGGTVGNSSGRTSGDFTGPMPGLPVDPTALVNPGVVTNGLRSGGRAIDGNSIDELIANPNRDAQSSSVAPGILSFTGLFTDGQVSMIMRGLDQKKNVDMMAQPSTVTRSGQSSKIEIIREFIYPTEYEPPELPQGGGGSTVLGGTSAAQIATPATPTAFEKRDVGIMLEVLPVADANKHYVDITVAPSFVQFDGFVNYGSPIQSQATAISAGGVIIPSTVTLTENTILMPIFSTQRTSTQLTVADGATIAIAGLISERIQTVEDKVPVLGSIPWIGRLFTTTATQPSSTAVIFLVRVELMDPTGRRYRDR
jgi:general secretion pathway protein D